MVQNVVGTVDIVGEKNNGQAFEGQNLYSGDDVTVGDVSELVMRMDADKYVYADANTHFSLEASDANEDSLIKIYLDKGSELNELQTKLGPNDEYEVDTPSSTLAVRGTTFRVTVYEDADGKTYTLLEVTEGFVEVELKTTDGVYTGVKETFTAGQSALIRADSSISEFLVGDEEEIVLKLNYAKLPEEAVPRLEALLEVVEGNVIKGDLELQGEEEDEENEDQALEPTPTPTPTPEVVLVPDPDGDGPDGGGDGDGEGDGEGTEQPLLQGRSLHIHTPSDWLLAQSASCLSDGYYLKVCTGCNAAVDSQTIAKTGHRLVDGVCANCGYGTPVAEDEPVVARANESSSSSSSEESTPSHTHSWSYSIREVEGDHIKTCSSCGESAVESHSYTAYMRRYGRCACGHEAVVEDCTNLGQSHQKGSEIISDTDGHYYACTVCGEPVKDEMVSSHSGSGEFYSSLLGHIETCSICEQEFVVSTHTWKYMDDAGAEVPESSATNRECTTSGCTLIEKKDGDGWVPKE